MQVAEEVPGKNKNMKALRSVIMRWHIFWFPGPALTLQDFAMALNEPRELKTTYFCFSNIFVMIDHNQSLLDYL